MSRLERRLHNEQVAGTEKDSAARLFAFSNHAAGYKIVYEPAEVPIVLKTKVGKSGSHACAQWAPLADAAFKRNAQLHAMYVLDTTSMGPAADADEDASHGALGATLRAASKIVTRLHPASASMLGAGPTALYVLKYALYAPQTNDGMLGKAVLLSPPSIEATFSLIRHAAKHSRTRPSSLPQLIIFVASAAAAKSWSAAASVDAASVSTFFSSIEIAEMPPASALWAALAETLVPSVAAGAERDMSRAESPAVFQITFMLSRYTKQIEQQVEPAFIDDDEDSGASARPALPAAAAARPAAELPQKSVAEGQDQDETSPGEAAEATDAPALPPLLSAAAMWGPLHHGPVDWEGIVLSSTQLGTAHGTVQVDAPGLVDVQSGIEADVGCAVRVRGTIERHGGVVTLRPAAEGMTMLKSDEAAASEMICAKDEIPPFSHSGAVRRVGCALIRGRKIVLVRSLTGEFPGMRFPTLLHDNAKMSAMECAARAACDQLDISLDNFYFHPCLPTVVFYPAPGEVCTLFLAIATYEPPGGSIRDKVEDEESSDVYDWVSFALGSRVLQTRQERAALDDIARAVRRAFDAAVYQPPTGLGVFGDPVAPPGAAPSGVLRVAIWPCGGRVPAPAELVAMGLASATDDVHVVGADDEDDVAVEWITTRVDRLASQSAGGGGGGGSSADAEGTAKFFVIIDGEYDLQYASEELLPKLTAPLNLTMLFLTVLESAAVMLVSPFSEQMKNETHLVTQAMEAIEISDVVVVAAASTDELCLIRDVIRTANAAASVVLSLAEALDPASSAAIVEAMLDAESPQSPRVAVVKYSRQLPFVPEALHALCVGSDPLLGALGPDVQLLQCYGQCWLSTRFAYRGVVSLRGAKLHVTGGDPWWCCVAEADRPEDVDPANWHRVHGDRAQELTFVVLLNDKVKSVDDAIERVSTAFDKLLCDADEERFWQRKRDPFPSWSVDAN